VRSTRPSPRPNSERAREQAALCESEQRFQALVQGAFEGLQLSVNGTIIVANEALARTIGCRAEEIVGRNGLDFCAPERRATVLEQIRAGNEAPYETMAMRVDGSTFPLSRRHSGSRAARPRADASCSCRRRLPSSTATQVS
jgi:PAS domain S-box-containing protein